ncbi:MAG: lysoplasmalogenase [Chloroflexota bacterium]
MIVAYLILALLYLATQHLRYRGHFLVKALPILLLAYWVSRSVTGTTEWLIIAALLCSAAGDVALAVNGDKYFVVGLGSFLVGHLFFTAAFLQTTAFTSIALLPIGFILLLGIVITQQLWPQLGKLKFPVLGYIIVSMVMGFSAALHTPLSWLAIVGAILFMLSDACIAINKFVRPIPYRDFVVMSSYYAAQLLLTLSFVSL